MTIVKASKLVELAPAFMNLIRTEIDTLRSDKDNRHGWQRNKTFDIEGLEVKTVTRSMGLFVENMELKNDPEFKVAQIVIRVNGMIIGPVCLQNTDLDGTGPTDQNYREITDSVIYKLMKEVAKKYIAETKVEESMTKLVRDLNYKDFGTLFIPNTTWYHDDTGYGITIMSDFGDPLFSIHTVDKLGLGFWTGPKTVEAITKYLLLVLEHMYCVGEWEREVLINI